MASGQVDFFYPWQHHDNIDHKMRSFKNLLQIDTLMGTFKIKLASLGLDLLFQFVYRWIINLLISAL